MTSHHQNTLKPCPACDHHPKEVWVTASRHGHLNVFDTDLPALTNARRYVPATNPQEDQALKREVYERDIEAAYRECWADSWERWNCGCDDLETAWQNSDAKARLDKEAGCT